MSGRGFFSRNGPGSRGDGRQKRGPRKPVRSEAARRPVAPLSGFPPRAQLVPRFLLRQADLIPGVKALYWGIRHNPSFRRSPIPIALMWELREPVLKVTGKKKLDLELAGNVFWLNNCSAREKKIRKKLEKELSKEQGAWLRKRRLGLLNTRDRLLRRNRQILIEFLYPTVPE